MSSQANIQTIILCGGKGTRLRLVLDDRQKCVAEVAGKPFLARLLLFCSGMGLNRFILCSGHMSETVRHAVSDLEGDLEIIHAVETQPLGTGGAIRKGLSLGETEQLLVLNGDSFCPFQYIELDGFHHEKNADLSMLLCHSSNRSDAGSVMLDSNGRLTSFWEKHIGTDMPNGSLINAGVYLINRSLYNQFPPKTPLSFENEVIPELLKTHAVYGFPTRLDLLDIGTPERLLCAGDFFAENCHVFPEDRRIPAWRDVVASVQKKK